VPGADLASKGAERFEQIAVTGDLVPYATKGRKRNRPLSQSPQSCESPVNHPQHRFLGRHQLSGGCLGKYFFCAPGRARNACPKVTQRCNVRVAKRIRPTDILRIGAGIPTRATCPLWVRGLPANSPLAIPRTRSGATGYSTHGSGRGCGPIEDTFNLNPRRDEEPVNWSWPMYLERCSCTLANVVFGESVPTKGVRGVNGDWRIVRRGDLRQSGLSLNLEGAPPRE
jgi:hypothetical protein